MVRHGIRGAVIALVCGSAVATAMGVLSRSAPVGWNGQRGESTQRVRYQIDAGNHGSTHNVRTVGERAPMVFVSAPLPEFMTRDTGAPAGASAGALAAASSIHNSGNALNAKTGPLAAPEFSAAVRGGAGGGFAYAYTNRFDRLTSEGLEVDLAQSQPDASRRSLGSETAFSANAGRGSQAAAGLAPFSGPDNPEQLPQTTPGTTNSTTNPAVASGPMGPEGLGAPVLPSQQTNPTSGSEIGSPGPSTASSAVPTPGTAALMGLASIAALRRRR